MLDFRANDAELADNRGHLIGTELDNLSRIVEVEGEVFACIVMTEQAERDAAERAAAEAIALEVDDIDLEEDDDEDGDHKKKKKHRKKDKK